MLDLDLDCFHFYSRSSSGGDLGLALVFPGDEQDSPRMRKGSTYYYRSRWNLGATHMAFTRIRLTLRPYSGV